MPRIGGRTLGLHLVVALGHGQEELVGRTLVRLGGLKSALQGNREVISSQILSPFRQKGPTGDAGEKTMKGINGLIVAVVLGLFGAAANFFYLNAEAQKTEHGRLHRNQEGRCPFARRPPHGRQPRESRGPQEPGREPQRLRVPVGRTRLCERQDGLADAGQQVVRRRPPPARRFRDAAQGT